MTEDDIARTSHDWELLKRLLGYVRPYPMQVAGALAAVVTNSVLQLLPPYLTKVVIDQYLPVKNFAGVDRVAFLFLIVLVATAALDSAQSYILQLTGQRVMFDMRVQIFRHLQRLHLAFYDRHPVGRLMTRVTTDVEVINELFTSGVHAIFFDLFTLAGIVFVLVGMNWRLALVTFSVVPLIVLVTEWFRRNVRESFRSVRAWVARLNSFLQEHIVGMATVQLFRAEGRVLRRFVHINEKHRQANMEAVFYYAVFYPAIEFLATLATALILWYGGARVMAGTLSLGSLVAFLLYAQRFFRPVADISEKLNSVQAAMASSERIFRLLDAPVAVQSPADSAGRELVPAGRDSVSAGRDWVSVGPEPVPAGRDSVSVGPEPVPTGRDSVSVGPEPVSAGRDSVSVGPEPVPAGRDSVSVGPELQLGARPAASVPGHIVFDHVWFAYQGDDFVLRDVSFEVRPGERVGIVGATGSGKSTLVSLLMRFYDVSRGRILVDGVDVREMDVRQLRRLFSLVLQDVQIFSGTIAGNVRLGDESIDDDAVRRAATAVHVDRFVEQLPDGWKSRVAERGSTFSAGQKQLLSFARALAFDSRILLLDEATSNVDTETELLVRDALRVVMAGRTTIAVAHRLSTIQDMDKILVLHKGELREAGTHDELLARRGLYYHLYELQYRDQVEDARREEAARAKRLAV